MANGSKSVAVTSWDTLKFSWWENEQSTANNTTEVGWKLELVAGSSGRISTSRLRPCSVVVDGSSYSDDVSVDIENNETLVLLSGVTEVEHDADGTKSFAYSFSQSFEGITFSSTALGVVSGSGTGDLTTINRGLVYIDNGSGFEAYQAYIDNGSGWDHYIPYVDNGTTFEQING